MTDSPLAALAGHRFPGGTRTIEHWENYLLTDCTVSDQLPDGLVHPIALFHVPIQGAGTSIAELFALCDVLATEHVSLEGYDWEYFVPLREDVAYRVDGGIDSVERNTSRHGTPYDRVIFSIEMHDGDVLVARVTNTWRIPRDL